MRTIWKYPIGVLSKQTIKAPAIDHPLSVQVQGEQLCLWIPVDTDAIKRSVVIEIVGTGQELPPAEWMTQTHFIGTVQIDSFVWHVFERVFYNV